MEFSRRKKLDSISNSDRLNAFCSDYEKGDIDYNSEPVHSSVNRPLKPKAIITLNIGSSLEQIKVFEGQDLYELATDFALKHELNEEFIDFLVERIQAQLNFKETGSKSRKNAKNPLQTAIIPKSIEKSPVPIDSLRVNDNRSFIVRPNQTTDSSNTNDNSLTGKSSSELHYENWQRVLKEKMVQTPTKDRGDKNSTPLKQGRSPRPSSQLNRSLSPLRVSEINEKLFNESKIVKEKLQVREKLKESKELEKCSFKPEISENSKRLAKREKSTHSIHEKLYEENSYIKEKLEKQQKSEFTKKHTFQPNSIEKSPSKMTIKSQKDLTARLINPKKKNENLIIDLKKKTALNEKECSFTPKITKDKYYALAKRKEEIEIENYSNFVIKFHRF